MQTSARTLTAAVLAGLAACAPSPDPKGGATVRDSAGIRIVASVSPALPVNAWTIEPTPVLQIGAREGGSSYDLFRVGAALLRDDGGLVVANGGSQEIRFYDRSGRHVRSAGRRGAGPGEFEALAWVRRYRGDSLLAYDPRRRRLSVLDADGGHGRVLAPGGTGAGPGQPLGSLADGSVLAVRTTPLQGLSDGIIRRAETLYRLSAEGEPVDSSAPLPGREMYANRTGGDLALVPILHTRSTLYAMGGTAIFAGSNDTWEIARLSMDLSPTLLMRRPVPPEPLTPADGRSLLARQLLQIDDTVRRVRTRRMLEHVPTAPSRPAYGELLVDQAGMLWVERYDPAGEEPSAFDVFAPDGTWRTTVTLPGGVRLLDVGPEHVVVRRTDELGVEFVQVLHLARGRPAGR